MPIRLWALAVSLVAALLLVAPAWAGAPCASSYSYAGFANAGSGYGIKATVTTVDIPDVAWGHVAAWVGVGGPGIGPNGEDEWIQVGFAGFASGDTGLYYEVTVPGSGPRYTEVAADVTPGVAHRIAVLEMAGRASTWRVWVDGVPASEPVFLAGSHGAWTPMATAESWNGGRASCNRFEYRFESVMVARSAGGGWHALDPGTTFEDPGYQVVTRAPAGFLARAM